MLSCFPISYHYADDFLFVNQFVEKSLAGCAPRCRWMNNDRIIM
ncbi:hypothetical protein HMPREF9148_02247 [Prevotella sp. F0091]|nr:hypothetical protein HMPREF9148_02247 [Prevotella sp. F0091]